MGSAVSALTANVLLSGWSANGYVLTGKKDRFIVAGISTNKSANDGMGCLGPLMDVRMGVRMGYKGSLSS